MNQSKNIKLTIAYEGTNYAGWQRQKNKKTIQGLIEDTIRNLTREQELKLYAAGRTDAGVHALGQVANFKTRSAIPVDRWLMILNNLLPPDIKIKNIEEVDNKFNARYRASSRIYRYFIMNDPGKSASYYTRKAFLSKYCYFLETPLDLEIMKKVAKYLLGIHDFSAFSCLNNQKKDSLAKSRVRNIKRINIIKKEPLVIFSMEADGFLYKMARLIVGTLISFSIEKREPEKILQILENKDSQKSGSVVPPNGLYLVKVKYK